MSEKELREKYGGKLPKAINRAIRAELPGGNEALDTLTRLAGPAMQSGWKKHNGEPTPEAKAYFQHQKFVIAPMEEKIKRKWGIRVLILDAAPRSTRSGDRARSSGTRASRSRAPAKNRGPEKRRSHGSRGPKSR